MKKRLIALLVIIVVLTTTIFTCTACSTGIFAVDDERDYFQAVATVTYKDLSKDIYKGQLYSYVYSYGSYYQQNYSMTIDDIVTYFYNNLTKNALLTLYAKYYIYNTASTDTSRFTYVDTSKAIKDLEAKDFVSLSQYIYAIEQTNDDFYSSFNTQLTTLEKEQATDDDDTTTDDSDELAARTVRTYDEDDTSTYDEDSIASGVAVIYGQKYEQITYGQITKDFIEKTLNTTVDEFITNMQFDKQIDTKIKAEKDKTKKANMKSALKTLRSNISDSYLDYNYFVTAQLDTVILQTYEDDLKTLSSASDSEISNLYSELKETAITSYLDVDDYSSALSDSTFTLANASQNYAGVKSILLKFSDTQSSVLKAIQTMYTADESYADELRDSMALGLDNEVLSMFLSSNDGIKVNVSNPFYDADNDELANAYTDKDVSYVAILYAMADSLASITKEITDAYKATDSYNSLSTEQKAINLAIVEYNAKVEAFTQWMYLVNDDSGMFSSKSYLITPDGKDSTYVEEYTVLARTLAAQDVGSYTSGNYNAGTTSSADASYTGTTTILQCSGTATIYKESLSSTTTSDTITGNVYTLVTEGGNTLSFTVNDYGIQIVMVTEKYGCSNFVDNAVDTVDKDGTDIYVYNYNYIYDQGCSIKYDDIYTAVAEGATFDANETYYTWAAGEYKEVDLEAFVSGTTYYTKSWGLKKVACESQTYKEYLDDTLVTRIFTDSFSVAQIGLYFNEGEDAGNYIVKNTKVYDEITKELNSD